PRWRSRGGVSAGLMWLQQREAAGALRHTCEQGEGQPRYGWLQHDGDAFGAQEIRERGLLLRTEFLKRPGGEHGGDWSWRITALPDPGTSTDTVRARGAAPCGRLQDPAVRNGNRVAPGGPGANAAPCAPQDALLSLFFYVATDGQGTLQPHVEDGARLASVTGSTEELGSFNISFLKPTTETGAEPKYASYHYLDAASPGLHLLTELVRGSLSKRGLFAPPAGPRRRF
ncbi:MOGS glucosidase, partial [Nothoprocta ornata]|nr:MOGS glucosidase [Nothoprocta ornata]